MMPGQGDSLRGLLLKLVGALLVLAGAALVAVTVQSQLAYRTMTVRHGGEVIELGRHANPQPGQHGSMARVVGTPTVVEAPADAEFNLRVDTPRLRRHVEMFQWREVRIGSSVHYEQDWVDHPLDASRFEQPAGHANPARFPLDSKQFDAGLVQMGGFTLSPILQRALPGSQPVAPDMKTLPANLAASFSRVGDTLVTSARPDDPRLGDLRVSWTEVPLQELTIVARIDGDRLAPAIGAGDGKGYDVEVGDMSLVDIFPDLPLPPDFVLGRQLIAVLLAALGAFALLWARQPDGRANPLLALALGLLAVAAVAGTLNLGRNNLASAVWFALMALSIGAAIWLARQSHRPKG